MRRERRAWVVVDLGFGDSGKGIVTDFLVRETGARTVVRFNGGAQAGHNVVTPDGRHHTFAQIGAGAFVPGVRTLLSQHVAVHPSALAVEARHLAARGVSDALARLHVHEDALVITPFHQAAGQVRELSRPDAHGSCGIGVGETVMDSLTPGLDVLRMRHLREDVPRLRAMLGRIQERKRDEALGLARRAPKAAMAPALSLLDDPRAGEAWLEAALPLADRVVDGDAAAALIDGTVVFEGAQGVLLDEWRGFHPHTTWSTCTPDNALALLGDYDGEITTLGVLRTYGTRHGAGPFPSEQPELAGVLSDPHNVEGPWQGALRFGWLDAVLLRYAIEVSGRIDGLALTHLDALPKLRPWRASIAYAGEVERALFDWAGARARRIRPSPPRDLDYQERLTRALFALSPVTFELDAERPARAVEALLERPVRLSSAGPSSRDVRWMRR